MTGTATEVAIPVEVVDRLVDVHRRLIAAVTPGHPEFLRSHGPHATYEDSEAYSALFSEWHAATRAFYLFSALPSPSTPTPGG